MSESGTTRRRLYLAGGTALAVGVEAGLYRVYFAGDGAFHWFTHFFAGGSLALFVMTVIARRRRRPVRLPLLWIVLTHLFAMGPDVMFTQEMAHRRWMDVFVAHNVSHFIPGGNVTWYLIFMGALGAYLVAMSTE